MIVKETVISNVRLLIPDVYIDKRGFFFEAINASALEKMGIDFHVVQENCAMSLKKGTMRGIHFQNAPFAQSKIVRCVKGRVVDYAIDLRKNSKTYLKYVSIELNDTNHYQLYIPKGFGHAVVSLEDDTIIEYYTDCSFSQENDRTINCFDKTIGIDWPFKDLILSEKDANAPFLRQSDCNF